MALKAGGSIPLDHPRPLVSPRAARTSRVTSRILGSVLRWRLHFAVALRTSSSTAEQWTLNPLVQGSNPWGCTIHRFDGGIPGKEVA